MAARAGFLSLRILAPFRARTYSNLGYDLFTFHHNEIIFFYMVIYLKCFSRCTWCVSVQKWKLGASSTRCDSTLAAPPPDDAVKEYPEKIKSIVGEISKLTLLEVADLNELLKVISTC